MEFDKPIIFFDLETTGVDIHKDRIVEIAAVKIFPDGKKEEKCKRLNPGISIPKEASDIHGITDDDVKDEPPFYAISKSVHEFFNGCNLGGYNIVRFDIFILMKEFERVGLKLDLNDIKFVDCYSVFVSKEPRTLEGAVKFYCEKEHEDAHSALSDVNATIDVLEKQIEKYNFESVSDLDVLSKDPDNVDLAGKLKWKNGKIIITFGQNRGKSIDKLETGYIKWMLQNDVIPDRRDVLEKALRGVFDNK